MGKSETLNDNIQPERDSSLDDTQVLAEDFEGSPSSVGVEPVGSLSVERKAIIIQGLKFAEEHGSDVGSHLHDMHSTSKSAQK